MTSYSLNSATGLTWTLRATAGPIDTPVADLDVPATVPGEVQLDLLAAGLIDDPFDGANEKIQAWIGYCDWQYRTTFDWTPDGAERHDLVADGLDTAATITLNGTEVGRTQNQHRGYRFDVATLLVAGENELVIDFRSPIEFAREQEALLGARPTVMHHPFNAIRKVASNFGWDWGIDISSSGIVKSIGIESWSGVRIATVRPLTDIDGDTGILHAHVDLEWATTTSSDETLSVSIDGVTESTVIKSGQADVTVRVDAGSIDRWWPRGYGDQPLYDVTVTVGGAEWSSRIGFRTIEIDTAPDRHGSPFSILVNGQLIGIRGANWIPDDAFVTRITRERYRTRIADAVDANMNLLRVWGGGMYESDDFYDACDELGVLVWQDFLFACAAYAEEDPLKSEVEAEARQNITRHSTHPSLALFNGCNENIWGYLEWDWRRQLGDRTWGEGYYLDLLPSLVAELAPGTPYSPGSPFSFTKYAHPNDPRNGTVHIWDVWNSKDYTVYADYAPRFASEFGFQGPPAWSTLTGAVHDEPLEPYGEQMLVHQKADQGNLKLERGLGAHLPQPRSIDEWHWATQLNQARALRFGIEHFRSLWPLNTGSIIWQLNDDWPVISWAAVDYFGHRKPLWHALKHAYADRLLTIQPRDGVPTLIAHNDSAERWTTTVAVSRQKFDGTKLATQNIDIEVEPRDIVSVPFDDDVLSVTDATRQFVEARTATENPAFWYFAEDPELALEPIEAALDITVDPSEGGLAVTLVAKSLVKDLVLQADRLYPQASVDKGLVTLAAGSSVVLTLTGVTDGAAVEGFPVLCSVNDLVTG
ncbi:glycoside hydrolase family 2 protein [Mycetocola zhadangensis]|uniref:glycoside hydrolase family 2 protein n=1 Tax=Mycetocola zhadangensis TaxID=1164595 RepID=UPI0019B67E0D|nr:glycoside hydrolase family 2 protein [Mycetocola zhadangensis]GGF04738.1 beta-mannosidase [Mycetocola zhadangensis]